MNLDIYVTLCGIRDISIHAIVEAERPSSVLKKDNTCFNISFPGYTIGQMKRQFI